MLELPPVPIPPTDLSAPHTASVIFLILCAAFMSVAVGLAAWRARKGEWLPALFLIGGLGAGLLEPMLDYLGLLWFAEDNFAIALEFFHRHIPLYVVLGYSFYFGGLSYIAYRAMVAGKSVRWFWGFFVVEWLLDFGLQATGAALGLYEYYGPQPFLILDVPAWWFTIDATMAFLAGGIVYLTRNHLYGWRQLLVIPLMPCAYAGINSAAGWPVFTALNTGPPDVVVWLAGAATMAIALGIRQLMLIAVMHSRENEQRRIAARASSP